MHPKLLKQGVRGFNLVGYLDRIYAIFQSEGAFELERVLGGGYSRVFQGESLEQVQKMVEEVVNE